VPRPLHSRNLPEVLVNPSCRLSILPFAAPLLFAGLVVAQPLPETLFSEMR
jgi:hypothetical protein